MTAAAQALAAPQSATTGAEATAATPDATQQPTAAEIEWAKGLAPEVALWASKKNFPDAGAALTSSYHLEKMLGQDKIPLPKDESDKAGWDAVWTKLGRPEKAEAYFEGAVDVWPEGFTPDPKLLEGFQKLAHDLGLNTRQARELAKWQVQAAQAAAPNAEAAEAAFEAASTAEWDALKTQHGPKFDALVADMQKAARYADVDGETFAKIERAIGTKAVTELFAKLGGAFGKEMPFVDGKTPGGTPSPEQARARIKELMADTAFARRYTEGDAQARREMNDLHKIASEG